MMFNGREGLRDDSEGFGTVGCRKGVAEEGHILTDLTYVLEGNHLAV